MSKLRDVLRKLVHSNVLQTGSRGEAPGRWAIFCNFLEKILILNSLNHISHVFRAIRKKEIHYYC